MRKAHHANSSFCAKSAGKVHGMIAICMGTAGGIRREVYCETKDDGGKPNRLAASRALLVPEAASLRNPSISTAMQVHVLLSKHGRPALVLDPPTFQFPQNV
ncbi:hypothetical protein TNCV_1232291 [Trichonephila clavipes]|nr:hypothetical protein TNCV_1232291 [Trichonephila clavipes]